MKKLESQKIRFIKENFPINELFKAGFFKSKTDFKHIEEKIISFFGLKDIYEYAIPVEQRSKHQKKKNQIITFWEIDYPINDN